MNSREIVKRTLAFENPERVAHSFPPSDFVFAGAKLPNPLTEWRKVGDHSWERTDEWGNIWGRVDETSKGQVIRGVLDDLEQVETFPLPNFSDSTYYSSTRNIFAASPDLWHIGDVEGFTFKMAQGLRKFDQYLVDLIDEPEKISRLHDRIDEQIRWQIKRLGEVGADSIMVREDWGTQLGTFISPRMWRSEFKPRIAKLCADAHQCNLSVIMHSCGKLTVIVPDLIECGVDVLQFDQPRVHGIDTLAEIQRQTPVTFWCPVDIQTTLQTKDERRIREEADELLDKLWAGRGGFMAKKYRDEPSIGLEPRWQEIARDEFVRRGVTQTYAARV